MQTLKQMQFRTVARDLQAAGTAGSKAVTTQEVVYGMASCGEMWVRPQCVFGFGRRECRPEGTLSPECKPAACVCAFSFLCAGGLGMLDFREVFWGSGGTGVDFWLLTCLDLTKDVAGGRSLDTFWLCLPFRLSCPDVGCVWVELLSGRSSRSLEAAEWSADRTRTATVGGTKAVGGFAILGVFGWEAWFVNEGWPFTDNPVCTSGASAPVEVWKRERGGNVPFLLPATSPGSSVFPFFKLSKYDAFSSSVFNCTLVKEFTSFRLFGRETFAAFGFWWFLLSCRSGLGYSLWASICGVFISFPWARSVELGRLLEGCSTWGCWRENNTRIY